MIFIASLYKQFIYHRRYIVNTIFTMLLFSVIFLVLMRGYSALSSSPLQYGSSVSALVVSYYAWTLMMSVYTSTGYVVESNKANGTMENIIVCSQKITTVLICESLSDSLVYFIFSWAIIGFLSWICSITLYVHVFTVFVVLMVGLLSVLGMSLVVAGMEMIFRKIGSVMSLLQFALLGGLFLPDSFLSRLLVPFYNANLLLKMTFLENYTFVDYGMSDVILLFTNSLLYLGIGCVCFRILLNQAKRKGTLSFY